MKSIRLAAVFMAAVSIFGVSAQDAAATAATAAGSNPQQPTDNPGADLNPRQFNAKGCFSSPGDMWDMGAYTFQTNGWCQALCLRQAVTYFALVNGTNCFCGSSEPPASLKVSSNDCDTTCGGYDGQNCGGQNRWAVYEDGYRNGDKTGTVHITTPSQTWFGHQATKSSTLKTVTSGTNSVVFVTTSSTPTDAPEQDDSSVGGGPNKAAIAGGVVVGVVGLAAIIGATVFYFRIRKKRALEEEQRKRDSIMRIVARPEKPGSFAGSDDRLEPSAMFQRRQSDGSIMDNHDYSRRILQVTNPDAR